jgi:hypothetical protein
LGFLESKDGADNIVLLADNGENCSKVGQRMRMEKGLEGGVRAVGGVLAGGNSAFGRGSRSSGRKSWREISRVGTRRSFESFEIRPFTTALMDLSL